MLCGGDPVKYNDCKSKTHKDNLASIPENIATYPSSDCNTPACNTPIRRHLQPVLVAKIYNQPIIEELPYSAMSLTLDNTASISNAYSDIKPMCDNMGNDGYNYTF